MEFRPKVISSGADPLVGHINEHLGTREFLFDTGSVFEFFGANHLRRTAGTSHWDLWSVDTHPTPAVSRRGRRWPVFSKFGAKD